MPLRNSVSGNWRVTFTFEDEDAFKVHLEDYLWRIWAMPNSWLNN